MKTCIRWLNKEIRRINALVELFEGYASQAKETRIDPRDRREVVKWEMIATSYEARKRYREKELETLRRVRNRMVEVLEDGIS